MRVCQFRHFGISCSGKLCASRIAGESKSFKPSTGCQFVARLLTLRRPIRQQFEGRESERPDMNDQKPVINQSAAEEIPENLAIEIRKLAHELSNALEVIVQTTYLLGTVELKEPGSEWLRMLDSGVRRALDLNLSLRTYIKQHSPK